MPCFSQRATGIHLPFLVDCSSVSTASTWTCQDCLICELGTLLVILAPVCCTRVWGWEGESCTFLQQQLQSIRLAHHSYLPLTFWLLINDKLTVVEFAGILNPKVKWGYFQAVWLPHAVCESAFQLLCAPPCSLFSMHPFIQQPLTSQLVRLGRAFLACGEINFTVDQKLSSIALGLSGQPMAWGNSIAEWPEQELSRQRHRCVILKTRSVCLASNAACTCL